MHRYCTLSMSTCIVQTDSSTSNVSYFSWNFKSCKEISTRRRVAHIKLQTKNNYEATQKPIQVRNWHDHCEQKWWNFAFLFRAPICKDKTCSSRYIEVIDKESNLISSNKADFSSFFTLKALIAPISLTQFLSRKIDW